jgi:hypothetical protein
MKAKMFAYLTQQDMHILSAEDLKDVEKVSKRVYLSSHDMSAQGWVLVGHVEADIEILPPNAVVENAVVAFRAKATEIRAKATAECTQLEGLVNQLLAIENGVQP